MRSFLFATSSLLFLAGCPETVEVDPPGHAHAVRLASGNFAVLATDVVSLDCDGLREDDLFGMELPMRLSMQRGGRAEASLAGLLLSGGMSGGVLELDGELAAPREDHGGDDVVIASSTTDEEAQGEETVDVPDEGEGVACAPDDGDDDDGDEDADKGDSDDVRPDNEGRGGRSGTVSLELVASRADHAAGYLAFSDRRCHFELAVEVQAVGGGDDKPRPVEAQGEESEPACGDVDADGEPMSDCG